MKIDNRLVRLESISLEAKGLYLILKSFEGQMFPSVEELCRMSNNIGRNKLYRIWNEVVKAELIIRDMVFNEEEETK